MLSGWTVTIICMVLGFIIFPPAGAVIGLVVGGGFHVIRKIMGEQ